jgi:hypothetical protein
MRLLLFLLLGAAPLAAQNTYDVSGTTVGASSVNLPAFGATPSNCQLATQAEPYQIHGFRGSAPGSYTVSVVEPVDVGFGDDTVLLLYRDNFDPAAPCTGFVAVGNDTPGSGLTATLDANQPYALVVAGFLGSEDAYQVRVAAPTGGTIAPDALPVELIGFDAVRTSAGVRLAWATASETDNAGFAVEVSAQEGVWQSVGWVDGAGTTNEAQQYAFTHVSAHPANVRYRLRQTDLDGATSLSPIVEVSAALEAALWLGAPAPHPATASSHIAFALEQTASATLTLYDVLGRRVRVLWQGTAQAGETLRTPLNQLPPGVYTARLRSAQHEASRTFVVAR